MRADFAFAGDTLDSIGEGLMNGTYRDAAMGQGVFGGDVIYGAIGIGLVTGIAGGARLATYAIKSAGVMVGQLLRGDLIGFTTNLFSTSFQLVYSGAYLAYRLVRGTFMLAVGLGVEALREVGDFAMAGLQLLTGDFSGAGRSLSRAVSVPVSFIVGAGRFAWSLATTLYGLASKLFSNPLTTGITVGVAALALIAPGLLTGALLFAGTLAGLAVVGFAVFKFFEGVFDNCFITTAVARSTGEPDDGPMLTTLRRFRDEYVRSRPGGCLDITSYERYAPLIVSRVEVRDDSNEVWHRVMDDYITPAVRSIQERRFEEAYSIYRNMFDHLMSITRLRVEPRLSLPPAT